MVKMAWNYRLYTGYCRKYIKMKNFASCLNFGNLWSWTRKTWNDYLFSFLLFLFVWWKNNSSGALPAGAKEMLLPGHHLTWWKGKLCFTKPSNLFICYLIFGYLGVPAVIFNSFKWTRNVPGSQSENTLLGINDDFERFSEMHFFSQSQFDFLHATCKTRCLGSSRCFTPLFSGGIPIIHHLQLALPQRG